MSSKLFYLLFLFGIPFLFVQNSDKEAHNKNTKSVQIDCKPITIQADCQPLTDSIVMYKGQLDSVKRESKRKIHILEDQQETIKLINQ